jgi:threonine/homoserine/homoserine lactone efflux protein
VRRRQKKNTLSADFITVFLMTFSNPLAIFVFLALFAAVHFVTESRHYLTSSLIVIGVFAGASLWWFTITTLVSLYRQKFRLKRLWWLNKITGAIISLLGLIALIKVFFVPGIPL